MALNVLKFKKFDIFLPHFCQINDLLASSFLNEKIVKIFAMVIHIYFSEKRT